jgi:hypothetical protein
VNDIVNQMIHFVALAFRTVAGSQRRNGLCRWRGLQESQILHEDTKSTKKEIDSAPREAL